MRVTVLPCAVVALLALAGMAAEPPTTRVELRGEAQSLSDALAEVTRQSGVAFVLSAINDAATTRVTPASGESLFWPVVWDLARQAQSNLDRIGSTPRAMQLNRYSPPRTPSGPQCAWGGSILMLDEATRDYNISYGERYWKSQSFTISGRLYVDPAIEIVAIKPEPLEFQAVDENGVSLVPPSPVEREWFASGEPGVLIQSFRWNLRYPPAGGGTIAALSGKMLVTVAEDFHTIEVDLEKLPFVTTTADGELTIESMTHQRYPQGNYGCEIKIVLTRPPEATGPARDLPGSGITVTDAAGHRYQKGGGGVMGQAPKVTYSVRLGLYGKDAGPPTKLTWRLPRRLTQQTIPFTFSNLKIPK